MSRAELKYRGSSTGLAPGVALDNRTVPRLFGAISDTAIHQFDREGCPSYSFPGTDVESIRS